jgi:CBS domain-containing protein/ribosome-associated translation inhibitor RaiA
MISAEDLLRKAAKDDFGDESIDRFMTTTVRTIHPDEPVSKAMKIFDEEDISRLPVLKNDRIIGIITIDDILTKITHPEHRQGGSGQYEDSSKFGTYMADKSEYLDLPVHGIMSETVDIMSSDENVRSIVESMFQKNYRGIIIGKQDELEGVVTKRDLLVPLASFTVLEPMIIQFSGELDRIKDFEKTRAREIIQTNFEKYLEYLDNAHIVVRLKQHDEQSKGRHIIYCKMRLSSPRGMFIGTDEGWGYLDAINKSSEAIDRQIRKQKTR